MANTSSPRPRPPQKLPVATVSALSQKALDRACIHVGGGYSGHGGPMGLWAMESSRGLWGFMEGGCHREKDKI